MLQSYVEIAWPGSFFANTYSMETMTRSVDFVMGFEEVQKCTMFRFYDCEVTVSAYEKSKGKPKNYSRWYYLKGRILSQEDVKREKGNCILLDNMTCNGWDYVIDCGAFYPLEPGDKVLVNGEWRTIKKKSEVN